MIFEYQVKEKPGVVLTVIMPKANDLNYAKEELKNMFGDNFVDAWVADEDKVD